MPMQCGHCSWQGQSEDRVPATAEWIAEHDVDPDWFTENALNCPECGESGAWTFTGEDAEENDYYGDDY